MGGKQNHLFVFLLDIGGINNGDCILEINSEGMRGRIFAQHLCMLRTLPLPLEITFICCEPIPQTVNQKHTFLCFFLTFI